MKWLKRLILFIIALIMLLGVVSLFLPDTAHVERSTVINAPASEVFVQVNSLKAFNEWSPWMDVDPNTQFTFSGPEFGVGSRVDWIGKSNSFDKGSQEILESIENEYVKTRLEFGMKGLSEAQFKLESVDGGTKITWLFDTFLANPVEKYFGLNMDDWVGQSYDKGLGRLKKLVEHRN